MAAGVAGVVAAGVVAAGVVAAGETRLPAPMRAAVIGAVDSIGLTTVRDLTAADAGRLAAWRYEGPWSVYDVADPDVFTPDNGYWAVVERGGGRLVGFVCLGPEARVAGLAEEAGVLDVGVGLDPSLVGRGQGRELLAPVVAWAEGQAADRGAGALRAVVQSWNTRSLRLCRSLGFGEVGRHMTPAAVEFVVLQLEVTAPDP